VFKVRIWFASAGLLGAAAIALLNLFPGRAPVVPVLTLSICSFGIASSNFWAIAQQAAPAALVGRALGYLNTISQLGGVTAPLITGWTLGPNRNFSPAILIAALSPLISCALLIGAGPSGIQRLKALLISASVHEPG
jgi:hypothetical protein